MTRSFHRAMLAFSALGILAFITLKGNVRLVALIFLAGFAVKTWLAELHRKHDK